ncbi:MAG TPA: N-acyl homoserine lactonase family protein, partial [Candidatus Limnocylindrales bacterium]|nr:N-acyl homoserine lactonase family protein [Candidatus Limnocylindrales bacterium]
MTDQIVPTTPWQIFALDTGSSMLDQSMLTYTRGFGQIISIPRIMWLLRGPTTVIVDTSVPRSGGAAEFIGEDFSRTDGQDPRNALGAAGVDPSDVELVVLTHLHWDHAGNCDLFPESRVVVQESELRYAIAPGRFFRRSFLSPLGGWGVPPFVVPNLDVVRGTTQLAPGLRVEPVPGHTPGSQAVVIETADGTFAIAGDAVMAYANVEDDIPPGFHTSVDEAVDSIDRLATLADSLLPAHDYAVFTDGPI